MEALPAPAHRHHRALIHHGSSLGVAVGLRSHVIAMFATENPKVEFRQSQAGTRTQVRLVLGTKTDEDLASLRTLGLGVKAAGARGVMFDDVHDRPSHPISTRASAGIDIVNVSSILATSPDRPNFSCLNHIHMTEPYHRLMAKQWLKVILGLPLSVNAK
jgi:hypothetical protein